MSFSKWDDVRQNAKQTAVFATWMRAISRDEDHGIVAVFLPIAKRDPSDK